MDALFFSSVVSDLRANAQLLLTNAPESLSLAFWGCGLLTIGASIRAFTTRASGARALILPAPRISASRTREHDSLSGSRA